VRIAALTSIVSLVLGGAFFVACSSSSSGGGGGTDGGGSGGQVVTGGTTSTGGTGTGGTTSSGGSGGSVADVPGSCANVCGSADPQGSGSGECYCDSSCSGNGDCCSDFQTSCTVTMPSGCLDPTKFTAFCNPVTNEGCSGTGVACDATSGAFVCFDPPNDVQPGGSCENANGPWCIPQYHCDQGGDAGSGTCKKYCCTNADCTGGGTCVALNSQIGTVGVCDSGGGGTGGTSGTGGAPADAGTD